MAYLIDTSVLARLANLADVFYPVAFRAVVELHRRGEVLRVAPQNMIEFRNVATRPIAANGLGLTAAEAAAKASIFEATFPLLEETPSIYPAWKALVAAFGVIGKQVHDARLVVICQVHGVSHLMSFNTAHFCADVCLRTGACGRRAGRCLTWSAAHRSASLVSFAHHRRRTRVNRAQLSAALDERCWMMSRGCSEPMSIRRVWIS